MTQIPESQQQKLSVADAINAMFSGDVLIVTSNDLDKLDHNCIASAHYQKRSSGLFTCWCNPENKPADLKPAGQNAQCLDVFSSESGKRTIIN